MKDIQYFLVRLKSKLLGEKHKESIHNWFRKQGIVLGQNVNICSNIVTTESHLIQIGDNTTIAANVTLITHDNSISKVIENSTDLFGRVSIGSNCFIGSNALIMYGVTIADNTIVAAGSVVTKSFLEEKTIIGGNPARIISTWDRFEKKNAKLFWNLNSITKEERIDLQSNSTRLVKR